MLHEIGAIRRNALVQVLSFGAMPFSEIRRVTGWKASTTFFYLSDLVDSGYVQIVANADRPQKRVYGVVNG